MDLASPIVRVLVVCPEPSRASRVLARSGATRPTDFDATVVLKSLGGPVEIEQVSGVEECGVRAAVNAPHLVVLGPVIDVDGNPSVHPEMASVLEVLRGSGSPIVVVVGPEDEAASLEAFRLGAADCVVAGESYAELLPEVALEHIREWQRRNEHDQAERHIRWLEHLNDAIVSEIPAALIVVESDGGVVVVNPQFARIFGVDSREVVGRQIDQVLSGEFVAAAGVEEVLGANRGWSSEPKLARLATADGGTRVFDIRSQALDGAGRVLFVLSDVTEQHRLARRVDDLQRYNENIIQNINSALLVVDTSGEIAFANPTAEQILGARSGSLAGQPVWNWFRSLPREEVQIAQTLRDGSRFKGAEAFVTRGDGRVVPIGISSTPLLDADGSGLGAVAIFQDLTEIKQLQRQVLQTEKMASIGQLAAGVAHEINNPMGFIHANLFQLAEYAGDLRRVWAEVERLREAAKGSDEAELKAAADELSAVAEEVGIDFVIGDLTKAVRESQEGSERIRHIVQDLRDFSHPDTAEPMPADVNQCVDSTASIVWTMMKHSVVLKKDYADLPEISCFPMQLKQVFMNLLVNAYQSIQERVGDSGETGEIMIQSRPVRDGVQITIQDTGAGIVPENLPRLFDPFFTTKEVGAGTGLGLSTSYGIVERHGGTIHVESEVGEGSTFEVWLPRAPADVGRIDGPGEASEGRR